MCDRKYSTVDTEWGICRAPLQKGVTSEELHALKHRFLELHDSNKDGKIDIKEVSIEGPPGSRLTAL